MALILAIEPDKRQASQLTAMVRGRLRADFVLGETAERALAALGDRVPDLILTSALLSPRDESALGERLRSLNGAAAHVHTLTIPVLSAPLGRPRSVARVGGMLSAFLSDRSKDAAGAPEGCDPAVFADQCREYLDRAAVERSALLEDAVAVEPAAVATPAPATEDVAVPPDADPLLREFFDPDEHDAPLSLMAAVAALAEEERAEPVSPGLEESEIGEPDSPVDHGLSTVPDDSAEIAAPLDEGAALEGSADVYQMEDVSSVAAEALGEPAGDARSAETAGLSDAMNETELYASRLRADVKCWPVLEELVAEAQAIAQAHAVTEAPGAAEGADQGHASAAAPSAEAVDLKEWTDIIETLRREAAQVPVEPAAVPAPSAWTPAEAPTTTAAPGNGGDGDAAAPGRKRKRRFYPVQDEWGFFDPDQAGFAALIAKLEEITEQDDPAIPRPS